ncbi:MAG: LysM domain-containing protein [Methylococcaceae bacterium]
MFSRTRFAVVLALLLSHSVVAEPLQLNPDHPNTYTVVPRDTLWDIAAKFLQHPWQWPQLWQLNSEIKNPNLIYPNDVLRLVMIEGQPQLSLSRHAPKMTAQGTCVFVEGDANHQRVDLAQGKDGHLSPCIRESAIETPVKMIPLATIAAYLSSPKVVSNIELAQAPHIVDFAGEHLITGAGDRIYVRAINQTNTPAYTVYRAGQPYIDPNTGELLGYEATYIAEANLEKTGDPATLIITKSSQELLMGDRLMPDDDESLMLDYFPRPPEKPITGSIISVLDGVNQVGKYDVVVINKGTRDGILAGHELTVYHKGQKVVDLFSSKKNDEVKLPDEQAGTLMVFRPFEKVSYALIMKANMAIHVLDKVQSF